MTLNGYKAMSYHCFVPGCETKLNRGEKRDKDGITLHKLPTNSIDLEIWLKILNCEHLTMSNSTRICSEHFHDYAFKTNNNVSRYLRTTATPFFPDYPDNEAEKTVLSAMIGQQNDTSLKQNQHSAKLDDLDRSCASRGNDSQQMDVKEAYKACMQMKGERDYLYRKLEEEVTKKFINQDGVLKSCKVTGKWTDSGAKCPQQDMLTEAIRDIARLNQTILELKRREAAVGICELPECNDTEPTPMAKKARLAEDYSHSPVEEQPQQDDNLVCRWDESGESRICGEVYPTVRDLMKHVTAHVSDISATKRGCCWEGCPTSRCPFQLMAGLVRHMYMHTSQVPYHCWRKGCRKVFTKLHEFKKHVQRHRRRLYICKYENCKKECTSSYGLTVHVRRDHSGEKPYGCLFDGCDETFVTKTELGHHVRTHADEAKDQKDLSETVT